MTFIDNSISLKLSPFIISDDVNRIVNQKYTWRYPEDFSYSASSYYTKNPKLFDNISITTLPEDNVLPCEGNLMISHGTIIPLSYHERSNIICKVELSSHDIHKRTSLDAFLLAKELSIEYLKTLKQVATDYRKKSSMIDDITVRNSYMLNVLPSTLPPLTSTLETIDAATSKLLHSYALIVTGEKGCGKTYLSLMIAAIFRLKYHHATFYLDCQQLQSSLLQMNDMLQELTAVFRYAALSAPSLVILDNLDALLPNIHSNAKYDGQKQRISPELAYQVKLLRDHIQFLIEGTRRSNEVQGQSTVLILLSCQDSSVFYEDFSSDDIPECIVPILTGSERFSTIHSMLCEKLRKTKVTISNSLQVAETSESFTPLDLKIVTSKIANAVRDGSDLEDCIIDILSNHIPINAQSLDLHHSDPKVHWSEIGGLFQAKSDLSDAILQPIKYKLIYDTLPITVPKGILLYGFPGCGKTCIVPALAKECNFNLVTCRGPELFDKYIGASEAKVRKLFEKAYALAPCILFLDEFDSLAPRRGSDNTGVTDRVVNQLLTFLDGVEKFRDDQNVYIIAASSRPDKIDPALLRPGRLEKHIFVGFATDKEEWSDLFSKIALKRELSHKLRGSVLNKSFTDVLFKADIPCLEFSAADIKGVFDTAQLKAVHEILDSPGDKSLNEAPVTEAHLLDAFTTSRPSLPKSDRMFLARTFAPFMCEEKNGYGHSDLLNDRERPLKTALK